MSSSSVASTAGPTKSRNKRVGIPAANPQANNPQTSKPANPQTRQLASNITAIRRQRGMVSLWATPRPYVMSTTRSDSPSTVNATSSPA